MRKIGYDIFEFTSKFQLVLTHLETIVWTFAKCFQINFSHPNSIKLSCSTQRYRNFHKYFLSTQQTFWYFFRTILHYHQILLIQMLFCESFFFHACRPHVWKNFSVIMKNIKEWMSHAEYDVRIKYGQYIYKSIALPPGHVGRLCQLSHTHL